MHSRSTSRCTPARTITATLPAHERENKIIARCSTKISDEHPQRDQLIEAVKADLEGIKQFIREKKIVTLGSRDNLKVIPTPEFYARHLLGCGLPRRASA